MPNWNLRRLRDRGPWTSISNWAPTGAGNRRRSFCLSSFCRVQRQKLLPLVPDWLGHCWGDYISIWLRFNIMSHCTVMTTSRNVQQTANEFSKEITMRFDRINRHAYCIKPKSNLIIRITLSFDLGLIFKSLSLEAIHTWQTSWTMLNSIVKIDMSMSCRNIKLL